MSAHFNYILASTEEIATYFETASRQTVASVRKNNKGTELGHKLEAAYSLMQERKNKRLMEGSK